MYQGWFALLRARTAPLTGVPAADGVPALTSRVANVSGCPSLSLWLASSHQLQSPALLPSETLVCVLRKVPSVAYSENGCTCVPTLACASKRVGMRVT